MKRRRRKGTRCVAAPTYQRVPVEEEHVAGRELAVDLGQHRRDGGHPRGVGDALAAELQ
eukprot:SAG22_NODE_10283_length_543_cov_1.166667_1_plen_58_part_01